MITPAYLELVWLAAGVLVVLIVLMMALALLHALVGQ